MKCGTSTLQSQLAAQPGVFMCTPKEPNFFSDDSVFSRGMAWYESLFADAPANVVKGEASTHYTKLPTYPACADRLHAALPDLKLIYMIRDPYDRIVSHFIHEWTMGVMSGSLDEAIARHPEFVAYSRYAMQIAPYVERYGLQRILVLELEAMQADPQGTLSRVARFLGLRDEPVWRAEHTEVNASMQRLRRVPLYSLFVEHPVAAAVRRAVIPQWVRDRVKDRLRLRERPDISDALRANLKPVFDADRVLLEDMFPELRRRPRR
jgi:hypothetical protein